MPIKADGSGEGLRRIRRNPLKKSAAKKTPAKPIEEIVEEATPGVPAEAPSTGGFMSIGGVRSQDVISFLRQLIMMLEAGTPLLKALHTLSERGERQGIRSLVTDISQYVEMGNPLWQAFGRHPLYFDPVFVNLVKASEASGTLVTVLQRLVDYRESREMLNKRIRSTMWYPVILFVVCGGVIALISYWVIPQFRGVFEQFDQPLPPFAAWFMDTMQFLTSLPFVVAAVVALAVLYILYKLWVSRPLNRLFADRLKLKIPKIGPDILRKTAVVEMTRSLALLLRSGLSMMVSLDLVEKSIHNRAVAEVLKKIRDSVERGAGIEEPLRDAWKGGNKLVPPVVTDMLVTGEESGQLDKIAEHIADSLDEEVTISVNTLGELIQPVLTVFIGAIVLLLFLSVFVPIISLIQAQTGG